MPIIGYNPWVDAANFGQGVGQSLSQGLLQLPQQRYALAQNAARMQMAQQLGLARLAEVAQRNQDTAQYHQGALQLGQNRSDIQSMRDQMQNMYNMMRLQQGRVEGGYWVPGVGGGGMGQQTQQSLPPFTNNPISAPPLSPFGGQQPQQTNSPVTMSQMSGPPQSGLPGGVVQLPQRQAPPMSDYQKLMTQIAAARLGLLGDTVSNAQPQNLATVSNLNQRINGPMQQGQTNMGYRVMQVGP